MNINPYYVGIDISKKDLEISSPSLNFSLNLPNSPDGLEKLLSHFHRLNHPLHIVCEPSGGHERLLLDSLCANNIAVSMVHASKVRYFARAKGILAKTDPIDAKVLAQFGSIFTPKPYTPPSKTERELASLVARRNDLNDIHLAENNRFKLLSPSSFVAKEIAKHLKSLERQIERIEAQLHKIVNADSSLSSKVARLSEVRGIGFITAVSLIALMPELGSLDRNAAAALAGLVPYNRDSGSSSLSRPIQGGRPEVRKALYMAAMVASRFNPILKEFYDRLRAKGKLHKVAITALMRKIITLANHLLKNPSFKLS
jgi:transposase